jgi:glycosyltransferase involved in cell wall biosynthesis
MKSSRSQETTLPPTPVCVSVIIPVYNGEAHLRECLDKTAEQTLRDIEIICVDDGSTDASRAIAEQYAARDGRFVVLTQQNQGSGPARNYGITSARGEYVVFMDCDDFYPHNTTLEKLYDETKKSGQVICGGALLTYDSHNGAYTTPSEKQECEYHEPALLRYTDYQFRWYYHRFMYKRAFLIENNLFFPPYLRYQDPPFLVNVMLKAQVYYRIPDVTYIYRHCHKEITWTVRKVRDCLKGIADTITLAETHHLETLRQSESAFLEWFIDNIFMNNQIQDTEKAAKKAELLRGAWRRLGRRQKGGYLIKSCAAFPWYIYKTHCLIYHNAPVQNITPLRALKAWLFFPYFAVKTYIGIAAAYPK